MGGDVMEDKEHKYYTSLYEIASEINSVDIPEKVLNTIVERAAKAMDAKGCSLLLLTPDKRLLLHTATYGLSAQYIRKRPVFVGQGYEEARKGRPLAIEDATTDERWQFRKEAKKEGIASVLTVPVMLKGEVVGLMVLYTAETRRFAEEDIYFASAVANLGAVALANARLYDSLKNNNEALRREIAEWRAALPLIRGEGQASRVVLETPEEPSQDVIPPG